MNTGQAKYWPEAFKKGKLLCETKNRNMNPEFVRKALSKVPNPHVLVNLVSRRVRQLNARAGAISRPLVTGVENLGEADIALLEIIEDKMGFELPEPVELTRPSAQNRRVPQGWGRPPVAKDKVAA